MNETEYQKGQALNHGKRQLRITLMLNDEHRNIIETLQAGKDKLAERASIVAWCKRENTPYSFYNLM